MEAPAPRPWYRKPPVLEAVLEFQFHPSHRPWDTVYLGKLHDRMQSKVELPQVRGILGASITFGPTGAEVESLPETGKRFSSADGGLVVTVGANILGVSFLPRKRADGHPGWDQLKQTAFLLLPVYQEVVQPMGVKQIGLRYINQLPVDTENFCLTQVVDKASGLVPPRFADQRNPFEFRYETYRHYEAEMARREVVMLAGRANPTGGGDLVLDIDEILTAMPILPYERLDQLCDELHNDVWSVFDSVFTSSIRESFEPLPETSGATR